MKTTQDFQKERLSAGQKVGVINLGCARNLVDAQMMLGRLEEKRPPHCGGRRSANSDRQHLFFY